MFMCLCRDLKKGVAMTLLVLFFPVCGSLVAPKFGERLRGNKNRGQQAWEVLRGKSASERLSEGLWEGGFSEIFRGFQRWGFQRFSEVFTGFERPSQSPSQSAIFLSELRVLLPLIVLPLKTPATNTVKQGKMQKWQTLKTVTSLNKEARLLKFHFS